MNAPPRRPFVLLADPARYRACPWDFSTDDEARAYWIPLLLRNFEITLRIGAQADAEDGQDPADIRQRIDRCRADWNERLLRYNASPATCGRVTILTLDRWRTRVLREHGFFDPYRHFKRRENERVLPLLPPLCRQLDALDAQPQVAALVEGVLAGNIFDMGAEATAKAFADRPPDFWSVRARLPRRPWLHDDFDALFARLTEQLGGGNTIRKLVFFVDNAGSDFVLGVVPLARALARSGTDVVLVANESPTLNDMTVAEVHWLWPKLLSTLPDLSRLPITVVSSGTGEPVIDLSEVGESLNHAAVGADLVLLEGMGRGVESNLDAELTCDRWNLAMIKDPFVASRHGGRLYDCVCVYRPSEAGGPGRVPRDSSTR